MTVVAVLVADGTGAAPGSGAIAAGAAAPWVEIDGHPLVWHAARRLLEAGVDRVLLVGGGGPRADAVAADASFEGAVDSVRAADGSGLSTALAAALAAEPRMVLMHDPTRAFAPVAMIQRVIDAVDNGEPYVIPVLPVVDTIRAVGADGRASALVDRDGLRIVQTPQGFAPAALRRYGGLPFGDDLTPTTVPGHADATRVLSPGEVDQARRAHGAAVILPGAGGRRVGSHG